MQAGAEREWVRGVLARYEQPLLRFAAQIVGPVHAPDVVQDTFLALCKAVRADVEPRLAPWLFVVCRNRALDVRRERGRMQPLDETRAEASADAASDSHGAEQRQALSRVEQIVGQLPERQQQALVLRFSAGMTYKQIAEVMELSVVHVGVVLHKAIANVRTRLREDGDEAIAGDASLPVRSEA